MSDDSAVRRDCRCPLARHRHGTTLAYNADQCRCPQCRAAVAEHFRTRYRRRVMVKYGAADPYYAPRVGVTRRLQALACIGWLDTEIGGRLGCTGAAVGMLRRDERRVYTTTLARVSAVYDELSMTVPPSSRYRARRVNQARRLGWVPPLAWDDDTIDDPAAQPCIAPVDVSGGPDEVAVDLIISGLLRVPRDSRAPERIEAVKRLAASGFSDGDIAARLGVRKSGVQKLRARHGIRSLVAPSSGERVA